MNRTLLESMHKGQFLKQKPDDAYKFIQELAENSQQWGRSNEDIALVEGVPKKPGMYSVKQDPEFTSTISKLATTVESLTKKIDAFNMSSANNVTSINMVEPCAQCGDISHSFDSCPVFANNEPTLEQIFTYNAYNRRPTANTFGNTYHPDMMNHPNFRWSQLNNVMSPPNYQSNSQPPTPNNNKAIVVDPMSNYQAPAAHPNNNVSLENTLKIVALNLEQANKQIEQG
ncbi:hypothetical protein FRX31_017867 [Thalictrum thalictroides]|uniref:Uncharacterized protein n=1 Tax=Thalictrum thalictroides TaxID=46969 RepID=A0A7J6W5B1_THATH|nr:hypothetical protein FRX31_017867 [Thalictrum thalictroides]